MCIILKKYLNGSICWKFPKLFAEKSINFGQNFGQILY